MNNIGLFKLLMIMICSASIVIMLIGISNYNDYKSEGYKHKHTFDKHYKWQIPIGIILFIVTTYFILHI